MNLIVCTIKLVMKYDCIYDANKKKQTFLALYSSHVVILEVLLLWRLLFV